MNKIDKKEIMKISYKSAFATCQCNSVDITSNQYKTHQNEHFSGNNFKKLKKFAIATFQESVKLVFI